MDANLTSLLNFKNEQRKLLSFSEKDRRKYLRNKERQLTKIQELLDSRPSLMRSQNDIALMLAADRLKDLDLSTRETNKNKPTIESLDSEIQNLRNEKRMMQMNLANGGKTMDIKQQTQNVAAQGRFGDSMLLHVNPAEVRGLAQAMPITINPQTGQPEAFLPFLAPIAGSLLGGSLLGGVVGSTLLGSAIGSGLTQYAITGDLKKGLLAGLTGYGIGSVLQGAGAAKQGAEAAAAAEKAIGDVAAKRATDAALLTPDLVDPSIVGVPTPGAAGSALNQAGIDAVNVARTQSLAANQPAIAQAAKTGFGDIAGSQAYLANDPSLSTAFTDAGGFSKEGFSNIVEGLSSPKAFAPIGVGMGTTSILDSQEAFERELFENEEERKRRRQAIIDANPENIPFKKGESTSFPDLTGDGKVTQADILKGRGVELQSGGNTRAAIESAIYEDDVDAIADMLSKAQSINPFAGADGSNQVAVPKRRPTAIPQGFMAGFQPEMQYFQNLNPTATEISGDQTYSGGLMPPRIRPKNISRPFDPTETAAYRNFYGQGADLDIPYQVDPYSPVSYGEKQRFFPMTGKDLGLPTGEGTPMPAGTVMEEPKEGPFSSLMGLTVKEGTPSVGITKAGKGAAKAGAPDVTQEEIEEFVSPALATGDPEASSEMIEKAISEAIASSPNVEELIPQITIPEQTSKPQISIPEVISEPQIASLPVMMQEAPSIPDPITISPTAFEIPRIPTAQNPLLTLPTNNLVTSRLSRLEAEEDVARPMVAMRQEGGTTNVDINDPLVVETIKFILGEIDSDTVVQRFIDKFSPEDYRNLRRQVLESIVPNAQTEGRIAGVNNGGMTDDIGGMIGGNQPVAVSQDEYIIPADAVAMLGDGSSASGAKKLDQMLDRIRMDKTGTTKQAKEIDDRVLPA